MYYLPIFIPVYKKTTNKMYVILKVTNNTYFKLFVNSQYISDGVRFILLFLSR